LAGEFRPGETIAVERGADGLVFRAVAAGVAV
jgi:hypothetical protein